MVTPPKKNAESKSLQVWAQETAAKGMQLQGIMGNCSTIGLDNLHYSAFWFGYNSGSQEKRRKILVDGQRAAVIVNEGPATAWSKQISLGSGPQ